MNVRFFTGTKAEYLSIPSHSRLALYFCTDTNELYWGDQCISDGMRVIPTYADLPSCAKAADGIVYYVADTHNGYTLSPDRTAWIQTIYAPAPDAYKVPEEEIYNTVTTVGAVRDIEKAIYTHVAEEIADFVTENDLIAKGYATQDYVTEKIADFMTEDDLLTKGYITQDYLFADTIIFDGGSATE